MPPVHSDTEKEAKATHMPSDDSNVDLPLNAERRVAQQRAETKLTTSDECVASLRRPARRAKHGIESLLSILSELILVKSTSDHFDKRSDYFYRDVTALDWSDLTDKNLCSRSCHVDMVARL